ncbi:hypothetical protein CCMSSC00406_0009998 [Pleurotus cornucopiae]|uniref:Uncharacterized protein n=1 Tax=Pleurotus cornucopiae TaxID=5321 RepID=A0ACB7JAC0_PLECO|nr:hypothetical protein CCMSSC00406_0009998 [Pleurotus cornucopiae]
MHRRTSPPDVAASNQRKLTHLRSQDPRLQTNPQRRRHTQTTRATTTPTTNTYPRRIIPRAKAGAQATTTTTTTSTAHWQRSACNAEEQPEQRALPVALDDEATTGRGPHNGPCLHHDAACARSRTAQPGVTTGSCEPRRVSTGARRGRGYSQASTLRDGSRLWGTRGTRHRVFFDGEGEDEDKDELEQGTRGVDDESGDVEGGGRRDDQREREAENEGRDGNGNDEGDGGVAGGVQSAKRGEAKGADGEDGKISSPRRRMGLGTQRTNATAQQSSVQLPPTPASISPFPIATRQSSTNCPRTMFALARRPGTECPDPIPDSPCGAYDTVCDLRQSLRAGVNDYGLVGDAKWGMERFASYGTDKAGSRYGPAIMGSRLWERVLGDGRATSQPRTGKGKGE